LLHAKPWKIFNSPLKRSIVKERDPRRAVGPIVVAGFGERQLNESGFFHPKKSISDSKVLKLAVGLPPIPALGQESRYVCPAQIIILRYDLTDVVQIILGVFSGAEPEEDIFFSHVENISKLIS
jgi:hypothetical protein